jgi:rubrerythrin
MKCKVTRREDEKARKVCPISRKLSYRTQGAAERALKTAQERGRPENRFYICPLCGFYHLSSQEKKAKK